MALGINIISSDPDLLCEGALKELRGALFGDQRGHHLAPPFSEPETGRLALWTTGSRPS
jgi:hypothetical protein